jgi:hypothetical protein
MLHRPQHDGDANRARRRAAQRRYRRRQRSGVMVLAVEVNAEVLDFVIRTAWAKDGDGAAELGRAVGRMLADAAKR